MKENCWILGGTGFIGYELIRHLAETHRYRLHMLVHQNIPFVELENHSLYTGNLEDFDWSWLKMYPPKIIFHLARLGSSNVLTRNLLAMKAAKANERLISYLKDQSLQPIVVYVSGSLIYGSQDDGLIADENSAWNPVSFARSSFMGEKPWLNEQYYESMDIRSARPGWILGKGSWLRDFYMQPFFETGSIPVYGDGTQQMSLIHAEDCSRLIIRLAEMGEKNQNLNIFACPPITQQEFAELLAAQLNAKVQRMPYELMIKNYGQTATEALTASIPMKTVFPGLYSGFAFRYPDAQSMVESIGSFFECEQRIFAKTP